MSELLCRLNANGVRYDSVGGGKPDLTMEDINGALARVANKIGSGLLRYLHNADDRDRYRFEVQVFSMLRDEYERRADAILNAELGYLLGGNRRGILERLLGYTSKKRVEWPAVEANVGRYVRVVLSVLDELVSGETCKTCNGRCKLATEQGVMECPDCGGKGSVADSQRRRAQRIAVTQRTFARDWEDPYRWLFSELKSAQNQASEEFRVALGRQS